MSDKIKQLAPQIWSEIQKANRILLHCHPNPDSDSAGGVLACKFALEKLGKQVMAIWGDSPPPQFLKSLPGFGDIIAKNWTQINPSEFDLFIILDSSSPGMISKLGEVVFPDSMNTIIVDHHTSNIGYAKLNLVETSSIAVCEILFYLFKLWSIELTPEIATNLFAGVYSDSGGFKYPKVSKDTFLAGAELVAAAPNFSQVMFEIDNNQDPKYVEYLGLFFSNIEHYYSGKVAICSVTLGELKKRNISADIEVPELANLIKSAIGNEIGIALTEDEPNVIRVSMRRRNDKFDLSKIAVATGSGGGHVAAAGATLKMPMSQAKKFMLETLQKVYPELGTP